MNVHKIDQFEQKKIKNNSSAQTKYMRTQSDNQIGSEGFVGKDEKEKCEFLQ